MIDICEISNAKENKEFVIEHLKKLKYHEDVDVYIDQTEKGFFGMRAAVSALAKMLKPKIYLNVGIGKGYNMSLVAHRCNKVQIHGFDNWSHPKHTAVRNDPRASIQYIKEELEKFDYRGIVEIHSGDAMYTLPTFFKSRNEKRLINEYLLIDIDAEHTRQAKMRDWSICAKHLAPGGYMLTYGMEIANDVWESLQYLFPNYEYKIIDRLGIVHRPKEK